MAAKKLFYSMGEVSEMFDVNPSLIRHWESKFDCIRPHKNKKGNRMFSPEDVQMLKQIYHLVKERGMTLEGANKVMRSSRKELSRDTELLERLQRIRSALVEVREELKAGDGEQLVESEGAEMDEVGMADAVGTGVGAFRSVGEPVTADDEPASASPEKTAAEPSPAGAGAAPEEPAAEEGAAADESVAAEPAADQPKKRVRRRRKSDDDNNKELFPFYEQSLF